jgi:hypothetical protein
LAGLKAIPCPYGIMCSQVAHGKAGTSADMDIEAEVEASRGISPLDMKWLVDFSRKYLQDLQRDAAHDNHEGKPYVEESDASKLVEWLKPLEVTDLPAQAAETMGEEMETDVSQLYIEATTKPCPKCGKYIHDASNRYRLGV